MQWLININVIGNNTADSSEFTQRENVIEIIRRNNPQYCNESSVLSCVLPTEEPSVSTTLIPSSLSSSDTGIVHCLL